MEKSLPFSRNSDGDRRRVTEDASQAEDELEMNLNRAVHC